MNQLSKPQDPDFSDETLDAAFAEIDDLQSDQPEFDVSEVETIELMKYFFSPDRFSTGFNWRSVALTIQNWMDHSDNHRVLLLTGEDPKDPDPEVLVLSYGKIDLWIFQGADTLIWHGPGKGLSADPNRPGIETLTNLPVNAVDLLRVLGMTSDPNAGDVVQLWNDLMNFLPTLGID
jgi:hypothetical protein